jgi:hypothetical protein
MTQRRPNVVKSCLLDARPSEATLRAKPCVLVCNRRGQSGFLSQAVFADVPIAPY